MHFHRNLSDKEVIMLAYFKSLSVINFRSKRLEYIVRCRILIKTHIEVNVTALSHFRLRIILGQALSFQQDRPDPGSGQLTYDLYQHPVKFSMGHDISHHESLNFCLEFLRHSRCNATIREHDITCDSENRLHLGGTCYASPICKTIRYLYWSSPECISEQ